jgi:ribonuclease R
MHRLGDVVDVRLVEAAPVAGALRFELLSEARLPQRGRKRHASAATAKIDPGRGTRRKDRKEGMQKSGQSKKGKSWKH